jgi:hypothetical protein
VEWIKWVKGLHQRPEVLQMAEALDMDPRDVAGRLMVVWEWADSVTQDGNVPGVTAFHIARLSGVKTFPAAMQKCGWLHVTREGLTFPHFDHHLGQSAKKRAKTAIRVARHREKCNARSVTGCNASVTLVTPLEKRREEERAPPYPPKGGAAGSPIGQKETGRICLEPSAQGDAGGPAQDQAVRQRVGRMGS